METEAANALLPDEPSSVIVNPKALVYTTIAEPKWGKSTWMSSIPNSLLLAFEQGHSFIKTHKIIIDAWDYVGKANQQDPYKDGNGDIHMTMMQAVDVITSSDKFDFVSMDTADMAVKMCLDYNLKRLGLAHQTDWDFGKGHDMAMNTPFRQAVGKLIKSGRGIGFITHTEIKTSQFANQQQRAKRDCTLPGGIIKFIVPQSDVILNGQFGPKLPNGRRSRIFVTEGADDVLAGMRGNVETFLPPKFIVNHEDPWGQWVSFFENPEATSQAMQEYEALRGAAKQEPAPAEPAAAPAKKVIHAKAR